MRMSWKTGLVNAFPIPEDRKVKKSQLNAEDIDCVKHTSESNSSLVIVNPFPFFDLPPELRSRIYHLVLLSKPTYQGADGRRKGSRIAAFLVNKRFHQEASYVLYTSQTFRIFPLQDFVHMPTVLEIPAHYRTLVTNLEMVVGSSWNSPPKSWRVTNGMSKALAKMKSVKTLTVFVELDPSPSVFAKYRISFEFYTDFCGNLLREVLKAMPQLNFVEMDGNPGVDVNGPLVCRLRAEAERKGKTVVWARQSAWAQKT